MGEVENEVDFSLRVDAFEKCLQFGSFCFDGQEGYKKVEEHEDEDAEGTDSDEGNVHRDEATFRGEVF